MSNRQEDTGENRDSQQSNVNTNWKLSKILSWKTQFCKHKDSWTLNIIKSFYKSFGTGFAIKAAFSLLLGLAKSK